MQKNDCSLLNFSKGSFPLCQKVYIIHPNVYSWNAGKSMYYPFVRRVFFQLDPERAHELTIQNLRRISGTSLMRLVHQKVINKPVQCMGITFKNLLGMAAGFDKNGECINALGSMGFGAIEVGTVTPRPQVGNDKPRLFRLVEAEGMINRMGFNNLGVDNLIKNLKKTNFDGVLGINIGKNKDTPLEKSIDDYLICMEKVYTYADYIAVNISSPNTPALRTLQYGEVLDNLLIAIKNKQWGLQKMHFKYVPVAIKLSPDLSHQELMHLADSLLRHNIDGVIATNTTIDRSLVRGMKHCDEIGGLSGRPIQLKSTEIVRALSTELNGRLPIVGVGGIDSVIAAREKIAAGASLVQIYSGFLFKGPTLIKEIINHL